jgi:hypothetical protein
MKSLVANIDLEWAFGTIVEVGAIIAGAGIVAWQVSEQFKRNRDLKKEEHRDRLFLDIFREIDALLNIAGFAQIKAQGYVRNILTNIEMALSPQLSQPQASFYELRANKFLEKDEALTRAVNDLIYKIESLEIIHPNFYIFRLALGAPIYDILTQSPALFPALLKVLPSDVPEDKQEALSAKVIHPQAPTTETYQQVKPLCDEYMKACDDIGCYIHDLRIELQNALLGSLFSHRVPKREPDDPSYKVISLTPDTYVEKLKKYFTEETNAGKSAQAAIAQAKANLLEPERQQ